MFTFKQSSNKHRLPWISGVSFQSTLSLRDDVDVPDDVTGKPSVVISGASVLNYHVQIPVRDGCSATALSYVNASF